MTQTKFVKIARATVVLAVQLAWILVKLVLLAAAAVLRGVTSGPAYPTLGYGEDVPQSHPAYNNPNDPIYPNYMGKRIN